MFAFSYNQIKALNEYSAGKMEAKNDLSRMILNLFKAIRVKLFLPCSVSGMYFFRDFED